MLVTKPNSNVSVIIVPAACTCYMMAVNIINFDLVVRNVVIIAVLFILAIIIDITAAITVIIII